jgi:hypothetical protein
VDYECCFLLRTSAASNCALPLKGRLIRAFLRALVEAYKTSKAFVVRNTGFGGDYRVRQISSVKKTSPGVFAGFGGDPALALMDAVV